MIFSGRDGLQPKLNVVGAADGSPGEADDDSAEVQNLRITQAAGIQAEIKV